MSGATMWEPDSGGNIIITNPAGTYIRESQATTAGQTLVTLTTFKYTLGVNALQVFLDGFEVQVTEVSSSSFNLPVTAIAGQSLSIWGLFGASGSLTQEQITVTDSHIAASLGSHLKAGANVTVSYDPLSGDSTISAATGKAFANKLLNPFFRTDFRNQGAAITPALGAGFICDRWKYSVSQAAKLTFQAQVASTIPGFDTSLKVTTAAAIAPAAGDLFLFEQLILASNLQDLQWNKPTAQPVYLKFWVKSSVAGKFVGGILGSVAPNFGYDFTYTIAAANVPQEISIAIPGAVAFSLAQGKTPLLRLQFVLGYGSSFFNTNVNQWLPNASGLAGPSDAMQLVAIPSATLEITGVDFQVGTQGAREFIPVEAEETLCAAYFERQAFVTGYPVAVGQANSATRVLATVTHRAKIRNAVALFAGSWGLASASAISYGVTGLTYTATGVDRGVLDGSVAAGLVAGNASMILPIAPSTITFDADF